MPLARPAPVDHLNLAVPDGHRISAVDQDPPRFLVSMDEHQLVALKAGEVVYVFVFGHEPVRGVCSPLHGLLLTVPCLGVLRHAVAGVDRDLETPPVRVVQGINLDVLRGSRGQTHVRVRGAADGDTHRVVGVGAVLHPVNQDLEHLCQQGTSYVSEYALLYMIGLQFRHRDA